MNATVSAFRTGCQKVPSVEDDPNGVDLRSSDLDNIVIQLENKHRLDLQDRMREQYEQRFRASVEMCPEWLDHEPTWMPVHRRPAATSGNGGSTSKAPTVEWTADQRRAWVASYHRPVLQGTPLQ